MTGARSLCQVEATDLGSSGRPGPFSGTSIASKARRPPASAKIFPGRRRCCGSPRPARGWKLSRPARRSAFVGPPPGPSFNSGRLSPLRGEPASWCSDAAWCQTMAHQLLEYRPVQRRRSGLRASAADVAAHCANRLGAEFPPGRRLRLGSSPSALRVLEVAERLAGSSRSRSGTQPAQRALLATGNVARSFSKILQPCLKPAAAM